MKPTLCRVLVGSLAATLSVSLCLGGLATAAPKYDRDKAKIDIDVKKTGRTEGLERRVKSEKKEEAQPELTADDFIQLQGKVRHIRGAQIQAFKELIADTSAKDPELPDLYFRLAELYAQQQRYWRFRAMELHAQIDKAKGSKKNQLKAQQQKYFKAEKAYLTEAIKVYATIANNEQFKDYSRMDEALFYYAYTLDSAKRIKLSRKVYHQLITDYPNSKYVPQAYLSFADYFFNSGDLDNAEKFYDKVLEFPKSSVYEYAMYKKGWVYLNQDRPQDALETFFRVANLTKGKKRQETLNKASKKDFVRAYAEVGRAEKAYRAFQRVDKGYAPKMLEILGALYMDQGQAEKAIFTFRELIGLRPKDPSICEWQGNVVTAMLSVGSNEQKTEAIENLVAIYRKVNRSKQTKGYALQECRDNARGTTGEMAKIWHNEAYKTLNWETLAFVERLYKAYVDGFPKADDVHEMRYYYADLLWIRAENEQNARLAAELWEKAAVTFTDVVKDRKLDAEKQKDAALAAVQGWKNALDVDPRTRVKPADMPAEGEDGDKIPEPRPIPEREQKMLAAFDIYIDFVKSPKDEELVMMKFLKARTLWRYDHLEKTLPMFYDIIDNHFEHETAEYSVQIVLDSLIRLHKYDELNDFVKKMSTKKAFLEEHEDIAMRLTDIRAKSMRKAAEQLEEEGKHVECGLAYQEIYNTNPEGPNMDEVLYNAGVCFEQGKSVGLAIRMFETLNQRYPKSVHTQKALVRMGNAYGAIAYYDKAADKYEEYARRFGGEKDAPEALQNAVTYRKGIGHDSQAIKDIEFFVKQYKRKMRDEAADAMWGLTGIYEKQGDPDDTIKAYKRYMREIGRAGGRDRLLIANARIGEILWEQSCKVKNEDGSCVRIRRERATRRRNRRRNALPTQCGPESKIDLTVVDRDRSKAREAQRYFRAALQEAKRGAIEKAPDDGRKAAAIYWMAATKFYLAQETYEEFLSIEVPKNLDFNPRNAAKAKASMKRFEKWMADKNKIGVRATKAFEEVRGIKGGGAAWAVGAAARIGQISQNFADGLYTTEIPKFVRTGPYAQDGVDAYCTQLDTVAKPLEDQSIAAYSFCLNLSTELNWFNKWSRLCEKELGQIRPADFPTATEVHADPNQVAAITDTQDVITKIQ